MYYSAFYATIALMLKHGIEVKSHNGVKLKLGEEFVKKGILSKELAKTYSLLADYRHKGDYDDLFDFDEAIIGRLLEPVKTFIEKIESILNKNEC